MKKYTVISACALACLTMRAAELDGIRYAGYTTNAVPAGFSIVAVPFSGFDTTSFLSTNLSLEALISTNGLTVGDRLIAFNEANTNYYYYALTATGWDPLDVTEVTPDSTNHVINAPALSSITKAQGYAFWLKTQNATTAQLQGIVNTNATSVAVAANALTLLGNALPTALDLNDSGFKTDNTWFTDGPPGIGDEIHVVNGSAYTKNVFFSGNWKLVQQTPSNTVFTADAATIPAGSGVWYNRRGGSATFILK
jgi:hypothetical protein